MRQSALEVRQSALEVRQSALEVRQSALDVRQATAILSIALLFQKLSRIHYKDITLKSPTIRRTMGGRQ